MKITNIYNLPDVFVRMAKQKSERPHAPNSYASVTGLLQPPRKTILERRHGDKIETDVSDLIYQLQGDAMHTIIEQHASKNEIVEERLSIEILGKNISGKADVYTRDILGIITDWKTTSVWKIIYADFTEWEFQLNCYAALYLAAGFRVDELHIIALLRDWNKHKINEPKYPAKQIVKIKLPLWETEKTIEKMTERLRLIIDAEKKLDYDLPLCTPTERWNDGDRFAVIEKGKKRAIRVLDTEAEAEQYRAENCEGKKTFIEKRCGEDRRCNDYCGVNRFCSYWQDLQTAQSAEGKK